ncbi:hypothetical protein KP509_28G067100 [Ceratopteris richardii]|uniref:C17orf113 probable zinc finger domain-containing protein n=1 Tax=Ceratopteris richardii TaxID=49495 RepID=A0A8T2RFF9_CERRI|nr:hypothetical protein KP509_28G067100 [Ceratopteris richardii]
MSQKTLFDAFKKVGMQKKRVSNENVSNLNLVDALLSNEGNTCTYDEEIIHMHAFDLNVEATFEDDHGNALSNEILNVEMQDAAHEHLHVIENDNEHVQNNLASVSSQANDASKCSEMRKVKVRKYKRTWETEFPFLKLIVDGDEEKMKCIWCETCKIDGPWGKGNGCKSIMKGAIRKHNRSLEHKLGSAKWFSARGKKMEDHVSNLNDRNKTRIITCMKLAYFFGKQDMALTKYEAICDLAYALDVKDMPLRKDYSSYTNLMAGKDFITSISNYLEVEQKSLVDKSPFYALMLDESTDRALEKHLIVYISFLDKEGYGVCNVQFLKLILVQDGYAQTKFDAIMNMISHMHLDLRKLVGISTDGDSSMLGCRDGLVAKLSRHVPHLISVHCVAHREALAIIDACKSFPCLSYIDKIANKIYSWISASTVRHTDFQKLLEEMNIQILEVLQICDVRWLAR